MDRNAPLPMDALTALSYSLLTVAAVAGIAVAGSAQLTLAVVIGVAWLGGMGLAIVGDWRRRARQQALGEALQVAFDGLMSGRPWTPLVGKAEAAGVAAHCNQVLGGVAQTFDRVRDLADDVRGMSRQLSETSNEASHAAMQVAQTVDQLARGAAEQTEGVTEAAAESEQMARAAVDVSDNARSTAETAAAAAQAAQVGRGALTEVVTKMATLRVTVADSANTVGRLGLLSQEIGQIVDLIRGLAGQTNLLALNAAIEAARAGEHGRGFAVVAEEVRKLAAESAQATGRIQTMIEEIQAETGRAVRAMERGTSEVEDGVHLIEQAGNAFTGIVQTIESTDRQVAQISRAAEALSAGVQRLTVAINGVAAVAEESAAGAQEVAASAQEQNGSMQDIQTVAGRLNEDADRLFEVIGGQRTSPAAQGRHLAIASGFAGRR